MIEYDEIERLIEKNLKFISVIDTNLISDAILKEFDECILKINDKEKIIRAIELICSAITYYIDGEYNKLLKRTKRQNREHKNNIIKKTSALICLLAKEYRDGTQQAILLELLQDMELNPYKYAKYPSVPDTYKITKQDFKNQLLEAFNLNSELIAKKNQKNGYWLKDRNCKNAVERLAKKIDIILEPKPTS